MVSIIVVNYNLSREVLACLKSLEHHLPQDSFNVIIVDNNSTDSEFGILIEHVEKKINMELILLKQNFGFGTACNIGAEKATSDMLCFLNPDTTIENDYLRCLLNTLHSSQSTIVGPVYNGPSLFEFSSGWFPNTVFESLSVVLIGRHLEAALMALKRRLAHSYIKVDWILGACMLLKKDDFSRLGGFDQDYFLYFEEVDLCKRVYDHGGSVALATDCRINHIGSVSGKRDYSLFTERFFQGKLRYLIKQTQGFKRYALVRIVWLQMCFQKLIWFVLRSIAPDKSRGKIKGLNQAISFYHTII
jgi:GT2 family glycosyltransferase